MARPLGEEFMFIKLFLLLLDKLVFADGCIMITRRVLKEKKSSWNILIVGKFFIWHFFEYIFSLKPWGGRVFE